MSKREIVALVVDDRAPALEILARFASDMSHTVIQATTVNQALEKFHAADHVDYVLQDLELPMVEGGRPMIEYGYRLIAQLRSLRPDDLYICVVSAEGTHADHSTTAHQVGANNYVTKPINVPKLLDAIDAAVELASRLTEPPRESASRVAERDMRIRAQTWRDCRLTIGEEVVASSAQGGPGRALTLGSTERNVLECFMRAGEGGTSLISEMPSKSTRQTGVSRLRKAIRATFRVKVGGDDDPIPHNMGGRGRYVPAFTIRNALGDEPEEALLEEVAPEICGCGDTFDPYRCTECEGRFVSDSCPECHGERVHNILPGLG